MTEYSNDDVYDSNLAIGIAGGNAKIAAELLALLLKDLPIQRQALNDAFNSDNLQELRRLNHKLHGSARYCGTPALERSTRELEMALGTASQDMIVKAVGRVQREINRLLELDSLIPHLSE